MFKTSYCLEPCLELELELEHELYFHQLSTYLQCILIMVIKCIFQMLYSIFGSSVINNINDN